MLEVLTSPDSVLRKRAQEIVDFSDPKLQKLIDQMIPTMYEKDGIGLAAPQVNKAIRLVVIVPDPEDFRKYKIKKDEALVVINPVITNHSVSTAKEEEGCLSVPGVFGVVKRWRSISVTYFDRTGKKITMKTENLLARVFQHEIDHLDGVLFVDRAESLYEIKKSRKVTGI